MKKLFLIVLSFFAIALATVSCDKRDDDFGPDLNKALTKGASEYDNIGVQHNQGLDYYLENADFRDARTQVEPLTIKYCESQGYTAEEVKATLRDPQVAAVINSDAPERAIREYFEASNKMRELEYFAQMQEALSAASPTAAVAVERLTGIEYAIAGDDELSAESKTALLQGLSVGKHSAEYWYAQSQLRSESPWIIKINEGGGEVSELRKPYWAIALADLAGGIMGGVGGAIAGSILYALP